MFTLEYDAYAGVVQIVREGFWDVAEVLRYKETMRRALQRAGSIGPFDLLINISKATPLSQDAAVAMDDVRRVIMESDVRRVAFVSEDALPRLQARRIASDDARVRLFENSAAAKAWLIGP